jgi:nicotinamidase/pyrazinamidase
MATALVVVDVQPTFCEGGQLPAAGGNDLAERLASYLAAQGRHFDVTVATRDAHIAPGAHFAAPGTEPDYVTSFPVHGVDGTADAELHPAIAGYPFDAVVAKGAYQGATNGFEGVTAGGEALGDLLRRHGVTEVYVAGLVYEICDADTADGAISEGFGAHLIADLCVALDPAGVAAVNERLRAAGVRIVSADQAARQAGAAK